jgi:GcrA cell cycle regulator
VGKTTWTIDEDQQLLQLERAGYSASLIGEQIKKTRNAVIGRSQRLRGYKRRGKAAPRAQETTMQKPTNPPPAVVSSPVPLPPAVAQRRLIPVIELTATTCRWPYGERPPLLYCGAPCPPDGSRPYCVQHTRIAFTTR